MFTTGEPFTSTRTSFLTCWFPVVWPVTMAPAAIALATANLICIFVFSWFLLNKTDGLGDSLFAKDQICLNGVIETVHIHRQPDPEHR